MKRPIEVMQSTFQRCAMSSLRSAAGRRGRVACISQGTVTEVTFKSTSRLLESSAWQSTAYAEKNCSIAKPLAFLGERWTLLVLRDLFLGRRRFDEFQDSLGVATNVLSARLATLTEEGIVERRRYSEHPERFEYVLTEKGRDLQPVLLALLAWGDRYTAENGRAAGGRPRRPRLPHGPDLLGVRRADRHPQRPQPPRPRRQRGTAARRRAAAAWLGH